MFKPEYDPEQSSGEELYNRSMDAMRNHPRRETMSQHPELRKELENTLKALNVSIDHIKDLARHRDVPAETMQYPDGKYIMFELLAAKAQVLNSLTSFRS